MKIAAQALALFLAAFLLAGCMTADKLNSVRIGMTKDQVTGLLGTPDSTSAQGNIEYLTYYLAAESGNNRDQPYSVRLVDGRVESFGRFAQLFDIYNRPVPGSAQAAPGVATAYPMAPAVSSDLGTQLEKIKILRDQGALTEQEFQLAKQRLLSGQH